MSHTLWIVLCISFRCVQAFGRLTMSPFRWNENRMQIWYFYPSCNSLYTLLTIGHPIHFRMNCNHIVQKTSYISCAEYPFPCFQCSVNRIYLLYFKYKPFNLCTNHLEMHHSYWPFWGFRIMQFLHVSLLLKRKWDLLVKF